MSPLYFSAGYLHHRQLQSSRSPPLSAADFDVRYGLAAAEQRLRSFSKSSLLAGNDVMASLVPYISHAGELTPFAMTSSADAANNHRQMSLSANDSRDELVGQQRVPLGEQTVAYVDRLRALLLSSTMPAAASRFTHTHLDAVLYGYAAASEPDTRPFALSGIRPVSTTGSLSYGIDQILCNETTNKVTSPIFSPKFMTSRRRQPSATGKMNPMSVNLPEGLEIKRTVWAGTVHCGVYCTLPVIPRGVRFGPYRGRVVNPSEIKANSDNSSMWEVFLDGSLSHFVDGRGSSGCWMSYVNCARFPHEQNMIAVQTTPTTSDGHTYCGPDCSETGGNRCSAHQQEVLSREHGGGVGAQIYYETSRDVTYGTELLVWYGDGYEQFMGIPISLKENTMSGTTFPGSPERRQAASDVSPGNPTLFRRPTSVASPSPRQQTTIKPTPTKSSLSTMTISSIIAEPQLQADRSETCAQNGEGFQCTRCGKVFAYQYYRDKHLKYTRCVDQGDRKFPCHLCSRSFEKRDRLRIHVLHVHEKHRPHKCSLCNKCFSQSSSLNKHMRVHSGERPYKCVYCSKAFTASSILRTHIRQHSGEKPFKCKFCGKAFASHAAHDSHARRTHGAPCASTSSMVCRQCGTTFDNLRDLKTHTCLAGIPGLSIGVGINECTRSDVSHSPSAFNDLRPDLFSPDDEPIDVVGFDASNDVIISRR